MGNTNLLALLQISDSAFPTGAFAHSLGLEACYEAGELRDAEDLRRVASRQISSLATSDCVALRSAFDAAGKADFDALLHMDALLAATKLARETREASEATGRRFLASVIALGVESEVLREVHRAARAGETPGGLAVGHGVAVRAMNLSVEDAVRAYLFSSVASLVAAGQKIIPLGGGAAQRVLFELRGDVEEAAEGSIGLGVGEMYSFTPLLDVRSMEHEDQRTRLYIS